MSSGTTTVAEYHQAEALRMSEVELQEHLRDTARLLGWRYYHTHDSRRSEAGFFDAVLLRRDRLVFAELKRQRTQRTPEQEEWRDDIVRFQFAGGGRGVEQYLWRPSDWLSGLITDALR